MIIKTYSELIRLPTFEERFEYLRLDGMVGEETFGFDRYLNQIFYKDPEWLAVRKFVIIRDNGCDLAMPDREIAGDLKLNDKKFRSTILVHHMNPISKEDILSRNKIILDPEYLVCTSKPTHNAIHYGNAELLAKDPIVRTRNDTCPWRL